MSIENRIEALYEASFDGPFPYEDCREIAKLLGRSTEDLIPELDWYFSNIAGYSSSATRLRNRSPEELRDAARILSKDFFQYFPEEEAYRGLIDPVQTPRLHKRLIASEELRVRLLELLREYSSVPSPKNSG